MRLRTMFRPTAYGADDTFAEAVVGDVSEPEALPGADTDACQRASLQADVAAGELALTSDGLCQGTLAVAVHTADTQDLHHRALAARPQRCRTARGTPLRKRR